MVEMIYRQYNESDIIVKHDSKTILLSKQVKLTNIQKYGAKSR